MFDTVSTASDLHFWAGNISVKMTMWLWSWHFISIDHTQVDYWLFASSSLCGFWPKDVSSSTIWKFLSCHVQDFSALYGSRLPALSSTQLCNARENASLNRHFHHSESGIDHLPSILKCPTANIVPYTWPGTSNWGLSTFGGPPRRILFWRHSSQHQWCKHVPPVRKASKARTGGSPIKQGQGEVP